MLVSEDFAGCGSAKGIAARQNCSNVDALSNAECVFKLDAKIPHSAIDFLVIEQKLYGATIASLSVNLCSFGSA